MHLKELLREELIVVDLKSAVHEVTAERSEQDKWKTIETLVDVLVKAKEVDLKDKNELLEALYERERKMTTGIEDGVAIPHAASDVVKQITAALGICKSGLDFQSIDGQPTYLIVLLVYPHIALQEHIRTLASVANLLNDEAIRKKLRNCQNSKEALQIIQRE
ncbi:TPA: PTS sugar transporter subunit IIA [Candidatus Poribacteria bacterium]|nr:PTS sugar transporter subunit IIA [Candidatus Poribacteria bacterium]